MIDRPCFLRQIVSVYFREHRVAVDSDGVQVPAADEEGGEGCVKGEGAQVFAVPAVDLYFVDIVWRIAFVVVGDISCRERNLSLLSSLRIAHDDRSRRISVAIICFILCFS